MINTNSEDNEIFPPINLIADEYLDPNHFFYNEPFDVQIIDLDPRSMLMSQDDLIVSFQQPNHVFYMEEINTNTEDDENDILSVNMNRN